MKSAVARLKTSPRPMFSRALLKLTSEFMVNLSKRAQVLSALVPNPPTVVMMRTSRRPPPWHGQLPPDPPQLLSPLPNPLAAQVSNQRAQRHFGLDGRHQEHGQRIAFVRNLDDIVVDAFAGHKLTCGLKRLPVQSFSLEHGPARQ